MTREETKQKYLNRIPVFTDYSLMQFGDDPCIIGTIRKCYILSVPKEDSFKAECLVVDDEKYGFCDILYDYLYSDCNSITHNRTGRNPDLIEGYWAGKQS